MGSLSFRRVDIKPDDRISSNFVWREHMCQCGLCKVILLHPLLYRSLESVRVALGAPITITSGFRCRWHNKAVGGAVASRHMLGDAADIKVRGVKPIDVAHAARDAGFTGIKVYRSWTHVDLRDGGEWFVGL